MTTEFYFKIPYFGFPFLTGGRKDQGKDGGLGEQGRRAKKGKEGDRG